ncbi:hypothetical protein COJ48_20675 [Bacillus cereus]|nr:hypothetical protein CN285_06500 [Bacillus cereus]PFM61887.1 hypothetical protein COJ48_20675 [Bacillus cereus]PGM65345.1 hypothetical protein CN947_04860 [Bacillus cereus]PGP79033.1 hypothetical protein CN997_19740 [Bacillus cereus]
MYYPLFLQYTAEVPTIFHLEIYDCTNTVWLEKKWGDKSSASFYRSDSSFHFPADDTLILCYLFILY